MAGSYVDVPAPRISYDADGTVIVITDQSRLNPVIKSAASVTALNDESAAQDDAMRYNGFFIFLFPQLRDIVGWCGNFRLYVSGGSLGVYTSVDTTNGTDGTWVFRQHWTSVGTTKDAFRTAIQTVSWLGIKGLAFGADTAGDPVKTDTMHLYGSLTAGQTPDRIAIWDPTTDVVLPPASLDWGNVPQGSSADKTFRVKNLSGSITATTITLSTTAITDTSPTVVGQHLLSYNGGPFAATAVIPSLAPGAISSLCTVRRITPSNAVLSLWWARINAVVTSW